MNDHELPEIENIRLVKCYPPNKPFDPANISPENEREIFELFLRRDIEPQGLHINEQDHRSKVEARFPDMTQFPYSAIVSIAGKTDENDIIAGTGYMISKKHVLTAGHVIAHKRKRGLPEKVFVAPGRSGDQLPFSAIEVVAIWVMDKDIDVKNINESVYDFAVLLLKREIGDETGYFGWADIDESFMHYRENDFCERLDIALRFNK